MVIQELVHAVVLALAVAFAWWLTRRLERANRRAPVGKLVAAKNACDAAAADALDLVASTCYRLVAEIPARHTDLAPQVNDLLSIAEGAAAMSRVLTPKSQPGTGDSLHVPGCSPEH